MWYFGCWKDPGHALYEVGGWKLIGVAAESVIRPEDIDGQFAPKVENEDQRAVATHYVNGFTIIAMWDRSVDRRFGSNCAFIERGRLSENEMWRKAEQQYPQIVSRLIAYQARRHP